MQKLPQDLTNDLNPTAFSPLGGPLRPNKKKKRPKTLGHGQDLGKSKIELIHNLALRLHPKIEIWRQRKNIEQRKSAIKGASKLPLSIIRALSLLCSTRIHINLQFLLILWKI